MMKLIAIAAGVMLMAAPLAAADMASGAQIKAAVSGNTVQGGMTDGTAYTEFYDPDGTIKAVDYSADWSIDGDKMCFDYGEGGECWNVVIDGDTVTWMNDGVSEGTGTILPGNPNNF
tara:strand:- start:60 stop:410 length:351 start_codon:yes stop_codon:yes gene_type:complete